MHSRGKQAEVDAVRLAANYLVVAIHLMILLGNTSHVGLEYSFWKWVSQSLAPIAMPTLFFISGYLFYMGSTKVWEKLRRRIGRLLVPYVLWNLIVGLLFALLCVLGFYKSASANLTSLTEIISWLMKKTMSLWHAPADMPTWYIRTIFIYALLGPVWLLFMHGRFWMLRFAVLTIVISIFELTLLQKGHFVDFLYTYPPYSLLCYCVGGVLAVSRKGIGWLYGRWRFLFLLMGIGAFVISNTVPCAIEFDCWVKLFEVMILISAAPELLKVYNLLPEYIRVSPFWIYVTHLPIFLMLSGIVPRLPFTSITIRLAIGLAIMFVLSLCAFGLIRKLLPHGFKALNGQLET